MVGEPSTGTPGIVGAGCAAGVGCAPIVDATGTVGFTAGAAVDDGVETGAIVSMRTPH